MPRNRGARERIALNTYRDAVGISAIARVAGHKPRELRFKHGTPQKTIKKKLDEARSEMRASVETPDAIAPPGSVGALILDYLGTMVNATQKRVATALLTPWLQALGPRPIETLTGLDVRRVINEWQEAQRQYEERRDGGELGPDEGPPGHAASTINHRRRELAKAWDAVLPDQKNIIRQAPKVQEPDPEDRAIDMRVLDAIINEIPVKSTGTLQHARNKARVRLRAMLWTGFAPATLKRIRVHHIDLERGIVRLKPRRKGKGTEAVTLPLFPEGIVAMRAWLHAFAWGKYSQSSVWKSFKNAVRKYERRMAKAGTPVALPPNLRPYDLRHSFLSWLVDEKDANPLTVQLFAQHASLETTKRYTQRAVSKQAARLARGESVAPSRGPQEQKSM